MSGFGFDLLTEQEATELLHKLIARAGGTGARIADNCTACGALFTSEHPAYRLELFYLPNEHRILAPLCRNCVIERERAPKAVGDRVEKQLAADFEELASEATEGGLTA